MVSSCKSKRERHHIRMNVSAGTRGKRVKKQVEDLVAAGIQTPAQATRSFSFWTVQLDRLTPITNLLDPSGVLSSKITSPVLRLLEARRYFFVHKGGIVDQKYLDVIKLAREWRCGEER
jgi:hypothetical protein